MGRSNTRNTLILSFIVFALAISLSTAPRVSRAAFDDSTLVSTATLEGRLSVFDDVWETIQDRYYDPRFHGIDWQAKRTAFRPVAARAGNTQEFYDVLRQMIERAAGGSRSHPRQTDRSSNGLATATSRRSRRSCVSGWMACTD